MIETATQQTEQPIVWHVGRSGEVAGGMTQVLNAYVNWPFEKINLQIINSRDGSLGLRGMILFLKALLKVLFLPRKGIVVVHLSQGGSFIREGFILRLAHFRGLGTVAQLHGSRFAEFSKQRSALVKKVLSAADKVHVLSEETQDVVCNMVAPNKVIYLPNAVALGEDNVKAKHVVFGGSVCLRKGIDVLTQAWLKLQPNPDWQLKIAGPVKATEWQQKPLPNAEYLGSIAHEELMRLLDDAAIAVLPSRDEAMPMFILEALARRCCVISTTVGGIPKVLDDERGFLVTPGDVESLENAMRLAIENDSERQQLAEKGFASFAENFSSEVIYPQLENLWLEVYQNAKKPAFL